MLPEMIASCGRNLPAKTAFVQGARTATWRQMDERSSRFAGALRALGIGAGETVAIMSQERIEVYEHWFGCLKTGAIRVGINWRYAAREMVHILRDCRPRLMLVDAHCAACLPDLAATLVEIGCLVAGFGQGHGQPLDYETLLAAAAPELEPVHYTGDETVLITYTSGTTGSPKGVMVSERATRTAILYTAMFSGVVADDIWYRPNQSSWIVLIGNSCGLANGVTMVIPDGVFEVKSFLSDIERLRVTVALLVPTSLQRMLDEYRTGSYDLSSLHTLIYGGGPISPRLLRQAREELGCKMVQVYGLTEATWVSYLRDGDHAAGFAGRTELLESAGTIAMHFEASIRDDSGRPLPSGEIGTLWLRGPCVMNGYLNLPELTADVLKPEGWLVTHDMGYLDKDGYLFLKDRKNFLIVSGGVNIYGSAVEAVLAEHPAIREIAVVGVPDDDWGEVVVAVVVLAAGARLDHAGMRGFCDGKLARMEVPKRLVVVDELPRTFTGKIDKIRIRKSLQDAASSLQ